MELMDIQEVSESSSAGNAASSSERRKRKRAASKSSVMQDSSDTSLTSHSSKACRENPSLTSTVQSLPSTSGVSTAAPKCFRPSVGLKSMEGLGDSAIRTCVNRRHECAAIIRDQHEPDQSKGIVCKLPCHLNDVVRHDSAPCSTRRILTRTGKHCVDQAVQQLSTHSLNCVDTIHRGRYSQILLAYSLSSLSYCVVKLVNKGTHICKRTLRTVKPCVETVGNIDEVKYLRQLKHPNIISIVDSMDTAFGKTAIVLEHCPIGKLQAVLDTCSVMTEIVARRYFHQMFNAISFIHSHRLAVMNICLDHFLLTNSNVVKLIDLSQVVSMSEELIPSSPPLLGVYGYRAPETVCMWDARFYPGPCDIWSLGVCLYRMVTGHAAILCHSSPEQAFPALYERNLFKISLELVELLKGMFIHPIGHRFNLNQIKYSNWLKVTSDLPCITGYYQLRRPRKVRLSRQESQLRSEIEL